MTEVKRDLHKDLEIVSLGDLSDPVDLMWDVVAPHALRRAIAAESLIQQKDAEIERIKDLLQGALGRLAAYSHDDDARYFAEKLQEDTP
jgi:hypothetical protein